MAVVGVRKLKGTNEDEGKVVAHFKRETCNEQEKRENKYMYKIHYIAEHTETGEKMVVYQAMYGDYKVYARPYDMFYSEVDHEKYPEIKQKYRFMEMRSY